MYTVEKVLGRKVEEGQVLYQIKWKGWSIEDSTWEPKKNLSNIKDLLEEFDNKTRSQGLAGAEEKRQRGRPPKSFNKVMPVVRSAHEELDLDRFVEQPLRETKVKRGRGRPKGSLGSAKLKKTFLEQVIQEREKESTEDHEEKDYIPVENQEDDSEEESDTHPRDNKVTSFMDVVSFDIPEQVLSVKKSETGEIYYFCEFKEKNDGSRKEPTLVDRVTMETYFAHLIFDFYNKSIFPNK